jgi:hypothetical protein
MSKKRIKKGADVSKMQPSRVDSIHFDKAAKARATARANQIRKQKQSNGRQRYNVSVKKGDPNKEPFGNYYIVEKRMNRRKK